MSAPGADRLYKLLPAAYRVRDADRGQPLHALLRVIDAEVGRLESDIVGLYDNWFIETCEEWVVPYIGDLLGVRPIRSIASAGVSLRAYVANTLAYRRRKGTALVLEQLARDVTGWPAHAVEFFQQLAIAQHMNHVRLIPTTLPRVRHAVDAQLAGTAFGNFAHVPDMRRIATRGGRYNAPNVGLFLWRLQSYSIGQRARGVDATDFGSARRIGTAGANVFSFHPVGVETPLFNVAAAEDDISHLAEEQNVPAPLRQLACAQELHAIRQGLTVPELRFLRQEAPAFRIFVRLAGSADLTEVPRDHIYMCCIPADVEASSPVPLAVAVDPGKGQLRFPDAFAIEAVFVSFAYGFPGDLGGGPYDRTESIHAVNHSLDSSADSTVRGFFKPDWQAGVSHLGESGSTQSPVFPDLRAAVDAWNSRPAGQVGVIAIMDSLTDTHSAAGASPPAPLEIHLAAGSKLLITGAGWPRDENLQRHAGVFTPFAVRPHLIGDIEVRGTAPSGGLDAGLLALNGLLMEGSVEVGAGNLGQLVVQHCTVVPGMGRVRIAQGNDRLQLRIERSMVGEIDIAAPVHDVAIVDSMVEGGTTWPSIALFAAQAPCSLESCTVIGRTFVRSLSASNCLFSGEVSVERRQTGCVRFSFVPAGSTTPRRYRCQPELAIDAQIERATAEAQAAGATLNDAQKAALREATLARVKPLFSTLRYGAAAYGQLDRRCAVEIRQGAEDGSEQGMYRFLQQPQREANLQTVLQEYLRFGLEAGTFFVT